MPGQITPPGWLPDALSAYSQLLSELLGFLVGAAVVYVVGYLLVVPVALRVVRARNRNNPTILTATETYLKALLVVFAIVSGVIGAGYGGVLTRSAIIIAAITFAAGVAGQEVFGSFISGVFLVADPDFNVGDWIAWPGGEGTVEAVDFRVTRISTPDNETITVPNTELTGNALRRPFGRDRFRVTEQALVAYDEDTERALMELQQVAANLEGALADPAPNARIVELGANAITVQAEFWVSDPARNDVLTIQSDFRREVKRRFDAEGITIAPASAQELSGELAVTRRTAAE
ncbi:mechanosensitive ion channel family protein [Halorarius halobius]|uniref:mechanosensitive ion channel family protein n=1 Tax=Halorarius halobius TaxID=2962671 RepID=UPI0020CF446C|nr:mechanosensitive ion channel domain-containing protein [Halorarius halobius]